MALVATSQFCSWQFGVPDAAPSSSAPGSPNHSIAVQSHTPTHFASQSCMVLTTWYSNELWLCVASLPRHPPRPRSVKRSASTWSAVPPDGASGGSLATTCGNALSRASASTSGKESAACSVSGAGFEELKLLEHTQTWPSVDVVVVGSVKVVVVAVVVVAVLVRAVVEAVVVVTVVTVVRVAVVVVVAVFEVVVAVTIVVVVAVVTLVVVGVAVVEDDVVAIARRSTKQ